MGALGSRIPNIREVRGDEQCNTHFLPSFMRLRYVKQVVPTIPSFLFSAIILRSSSRYLSLDVNKPLSTADGKRSRRNILAKLCTAPSHLLPPSSRSPSPRVETTFLTRPYCLVSLPTISQIFFPSPPSIAFARTWFGVGGCSTAQPQPPRICSHPGWWAQQNAADSQDFAVASTPLICVRSVSRRKSIAGPSFAFARCTFAVASRMQGNGCEVLSPVCGRCAHLSHSSVSVPRYICSH
jgi:hypothetical protein